MSRGNVVHTADRSAGDLAAGPVQRLFVFAGDGQTDGQTDVLM